MDKFSDYLIPYVAPLTHGLILVCSRGSTEDEASSYSLASYFGGNLLAAAIYQTSRVRHFDVPWQWTKDRAAGEGHAETILDIADRMPTIMPCHSDAIKNRFAPVADIVLEVAEHPSFATVTRSRDFTFGSTGWTISLSSDGNWRLVHPYPLRVIENRPGYRRTGCNGLSLPGFVEVTTEGKPNDPFLGAMTRREVIGLPGFPKDTAHE